MAHSQVENLDPNVLELGSELIFPQKPKPTWLRSLAAVVRNQNHGQLVRRNPVFLSHAPISANDMVLKTWSGHSEQRSEGSSSAVEQKIKPTTTFTTRIEARQKFIYAVTGTRKISMPALSEACTWYLDYLESKIKEEWITLLRPVLSDIEDIAHFPSERDIAVAFSFLSAVVMELKCVDVALTDICDFVYNEDLLKYTDSNRTEATQLIFTVVGWITSMYSSKPVQNSEFLEISSTQPQGRETSPTFGYKRVQHSVQTDRRLHMEDWRDQPMHSLLMKIGNFFPTTIVDTEGEETDICFDKSLLNFYNLCKVASIEIEWVESVCLHLDFNSRAKTLKLFRFPCLCLLQVPHEMISYLWSHANEFCASLLIQTSSASCWFELNGQTDVRQYYFEVLLSYRLIFGENKDASRLLNKLLSNEQDTWGTHTDPLLGILCGKNGGEATAKDIYDTLEADCGASTYSTSDFCFLGSRLLKLQNYMRKETKQEDISNLRGEKNSILRGMLCDLISIGGTTVLLTFCQFLLQIIQVVYAKQQVNAANKA